jgi:hypothetical protein
MYSYIPSSAQAPAEASVPVSGAAPSVPEAAPCIPEMASAEIASPGLGRVQGSGLEFRGKNGQGKDKELAGGRRRTGRPLVSRSAHARTHEGAHTSSLSFSRFDGFRARGGGFWV